MKTDASRITLLSRLKFVSTIFNRYSYLHYLIDYIFGQQIWRSYAIFCNAERNIATCVSCRQKIRYVLNIHTFIFRWVNI